MPTMTPSVYTIGQLAAGAGVPITTVRYYERNGLLRPDGRTSGNYRCYSAQSLERLRFIRAAQATGLGLRDVAELLELTTSPSSPCPDVVATLQKRLADVRVKMNDLRSVEKALKAALETCCSDGNFDLCKSLERMRNKKSVGAP